VEIVITPTRGPMIIALSAIISDLKCPDISFQGLKEEGEVIRSFFKNNPE